jgi:hypothetical protein
MDRALVLKNKIDGGIVLNQETIDYFLSSSELVGNLTGEFSESSLYPIWRIIALSEIPYAERLEYTQKLIEYIESAYSTASGFSITGDSAGIVPCYNAMIAEALLKLGCGERASVKSAIEWMKNYQVFSRKENTSWNGTGIKKYGGCMKSTPCYIGVAKSLKALIYYREYVDLIDEEVSNKINIGTEYLLHHNLYQRLSDGTPITKHILDLAFPPSYQLNILELLEIMFKTKNMNDPRLESVIEYLTKKRMKDNGWRINYVYKAEGYISFDRKGLKGEWVTHLLEKYLNQII